MIPIVRRLVLLAAVVAASAFTPAPPADWADVSLYRQAMKPGFERDVDRFATANRYLIDASLSVDPNAVIQGSERVRYTNRTSHSLSEIVFRLYPNTPVLNGRMTVSNVAVDGHAVSPRFAQSESIMALQLAEPLAVGSAVDITMDFSVVMTEGADASYGRFGFVHGVVSATAWYPTLSVYDEGLGWWQGVPSPEGDPAYTESGLYDVRLTVPAAWTVAQSGTEITTTANGDGTVTHRDVTGPMRDHAFLASTRYTAVSGEQDGVRINVWHYADAGRAPGDGTADVLMYARNALRVYGQTYGPYPFKEFDVVENPTPTGVEFPGLVQISEGEWQKGSRDLEITVAHEAAHQWFYSLIGNDQVNHAWLDEGLASYAEFVYMRAVHPSEAAAYIEADENAYAEYRRNSGADLPVDLPIARYSRYAYGMLVYTKSAIFMLQLERDLGREVLQRGLADYFRTNEYGVVTTPDLERAIERASGTDLKTAFRQWTGGSLN